MAGANETYTIDIKAALAGGDSVTSKLDSLSKSIGGANQSADYLEAALAQVSTALASAKAATADADSALAEGNAQWAELEANATRAAKAFEKAALKGPVTKEIADQALAAKDALDAYGVTLAGLEKASADARTSQDALAIVMGSTRDQARAAAAAEAAQAKAAADAARQTRDEAEQIAKAAEKEAKAVEAAKKAEAAAAEAAAEAVKAAEKAQAKAAEDAAKDAKKAAEDAAAAARAPFEAAKDTAQEIGHFRGSVAALPGPLGQLASAVLAPAQAFKKLEGSLGGARAAEVLAIASTAALAVAYIAVTAAIAAAVVKVTAWAVGLSDATRSAKLAGEAFAAMNPDLAGLPFDEIGRDTLVSADRLHALAQALKTAGVAADQMPAALHAAATAERALGQEGSQKFLDNIKDGKQAVSSLAAQTEKDLGGIVARQLLGLDAQSERFQQNIGGLFGSLDIEPLLLGLSKLVALFDRNTEAGQALQFLFDTFFQPLIDSADTAATAIEAFYLGMLIGAMKLYLALKPVIKPILELFGLDDPTLELNFKAITAAGEVFGKMLLVLSAVIVGITAVFALMGAALLAIPTAFLYVQGKAQEFGLYLGKIFGQVVNYIETLPGVFGTLGKLMIDGLITGITGQLGAVISAISGVVRGAIAAAEGILKIGSPSKVFADIGAYTAEGFAGGVEDSTDAAHSAVAAMVSPGLDAAAASAGAAPAGAAEAGGAAGGSSRTINLYNPVIQLGAGAPKEQAQEFVTWITELLEGDAAQAAGA